LVFFLYSFLSCHSFYNWLFFFPQVFAIGFHIVCFCPIPLNTISVAIDFFLPLAKNVHDFTIVFLLLNNWSWKWENLSMTHWTAVTHTNTMFIFLFHKMILRKKKSISEEKGFDFFYSFAFNNSLCHSFNYFFFSLKVKKSPHIFVYIINIFCFFVHILTRQKNCFTIGSIFVVLSHFFIFVYKY